MSLTLSEALERLLIDPAYRADFLAGRDGRLGLDEKDLDALSTIDREQLRFTAERIEADLVARQYRGSGDVKKRFPRTIAAWRTAHPDDIDLRVLSRAFLASPAYRAYREVPFAGAGQCLEEAFFHFAEASEVGTPSDREHDYLSAVIRALALSPIPAFTLPSGVRRARRGFFALATRGNPAAPLLFAAVGGQLIEGPLTPFLADLLREPTTAEAVAQRHRVSADVLHASQEKLRAMGLLG